ncbi:MAG: FkbM family methyltransferase [Steroidobacteraceae bacterium]
MDADGSAITKATRGLPHGSHCLDVGANIGITALCLAAQRPDCRITAFEPVPANAECLRRNVQANSIENIEIVEAAVSDSRGLVAMTNNGPWSSATEGGPVHVRTIPLDDYTDRPIAFVKIDTEGYEPHVFSGARRLFAERRPLVFAEFNSWLLLERHYDLIVFASAIWSSFDVLDVYHNERSIPVPPSGFSFVHMNLLEHGFVTDLLLRPRSDMPDLCAMIEAPEAQRLREEVRALRSALCLARDGKSGF